MPRTRIKICGITRRVDALEAIQAGADALGLVFYPGSSRAVDVAAAGEIVDDLPPFVSLVGLFVDAPAQQVAHACANLPLSLLQFHGAESVAYCEQFALPYMKAVRVARDSNVQQELTGFASARAMLLDTWQSGQPGGTGECFDWSQVPAHTARSIVLAGGLNADNVGAAIAQVAPYAVDVSGGVEQAPGRKCAIKLRQFVEAVRRADQGDAAMPQQK